MFQPLPLTCHPLTLPFLPLLHDFFFFAHTARGAFAVCYSFLFFKAYLFVLRSKRESKRERERERGERERGGERERDRERESEGVGERDRERGREKERER